VKVPKHWNLLRDCGLRMYFLQDAAIVNPGLVRYLRPGRRPGKPWAAQSGWSVGTLHIIPVDRRPHYVTPAIPGDAGLGRGPVL